MTEPVFELRNISKRFGPTAALSEMSLAILPGEVHAIVGENGAGKSTLIKVMTGVHRPDTGEMLCNGVPVSFRSTFDAQESGVAAIYQEPMVFPDLDVAENIFISHNRQPALMNWRRLYGQAEEIIARLGVTLDVRRAAAGLTVAEQQTVEIARALSLNVRVLIMDEPTAALSAHEEERLHAIVAALRAAGVAVIYITHRMEEIFKVADRVTVIRDGLHISTRSIAGVGQADIVHDMVGREIDLVSVKSAANPRGERILSVRGLGREGVFENVGFDLHRGEVLCLAGLVGSRRTDVALALFGVNPADRGAVEIDGRSVVITTPQQAMGLGIAYVSEDRRKLGLAMEMPIAANVSLPSLGRLIRRLGFIDRRAERQMAEGYREKLSIRTESVTASVGRLSGGNQQKVMLAKWLETRPRILIFDEPTRGVDVGAKAEVHGIIRQMAGAGVAIIVISSDLPEVLSLADRVLVMREGALVGEFGIAEASQERIMAVATAGTVAA